MRMHRLQHLRYLVMRNQLHVQLAKRLLVLDVGNMHVLNVEKKNRLVERVIVSGRAHVMSATKSVTSVVIHLVACV